MPDTTANYGWRIPKADGTDLIVPDDVRSPITSIDAALKNSDNSAASLAARVTALETNAPVTLSGAAAIVVATGYTLSSATVEKRTHVVYCTWVIRRTGATIASDSLGNLPNSIIGTVVAGYRPVQSTAFSPTDTLIPVFGYVSATGDIVVTLTAPNVDLATNTDIRASVMYFSN